MNRQTLEKFQVFVYFLAILLGFGAGHVWPEWASLMEALLWPALAALLFVTFCQISIRKIGEAFTDTRFLTAAAGGNFLVIPLIVWGLLIFLPDIAAIQLGVAMVLLVPCIDWFISFTHLGRGAASHAVAFVPLSLLLQFLLLPVWLFLFFGRDFAVSLASFDLLTAFFLLIVLPLLLAGITRKWTGKQPGSKQITDTLAWLPVPLLALVVFIVAMSQFQAIMTSGHLLWQPVVIYIAYLMIALILSRIAVGIMNLDIPTGRTLAFSFGSRNSFVVLPLALALPESFELVAVVIVFQSVVELFGMIFYVWFVPHILLPEKVPES